MEDLFLERPVEAFGNAIDPRFGDGSEAGRDAPELDLAEEIAGGILRAAVHAQGRIAPRAGAGSAKHRLEPPRNRPQGGKTIAGLRGMNAGATGIEMVCRREDPYPAIVHRLGSNAAGAPHFVRPVCDGGFRRADWGRPRAAGGARAAGSRPTRRGTRVLEERMLRRMRGRAQALRCSSPVKGEVARSARMAARRSASAIFGFGPRRAGNSGTTVAACRAYRAQIVGRGNSSTRQTRSRP